jgi:hypothetical protein
MDDDLRFWRGLFWGSLISAILWALIAAAIWRLV